MFFVSIHEWDIFKNESFLATSQTSIVLSHVNGEMVWGEQSSTFSRLGCASPSQTWQFLSRTFPSSAWTSLSKLCNMFAIILKISCLPRSVYLRASITLFVKCTLFASKFLKFCLKAPYRSAMFWICLFKLPLFAISASRLCIDTRLPSSICLNEHHTGGFVPNISLNLCYR